MAKNSTLFPFRFDTQDLKNEMLKEIIENPAIGKDLTQYINNVLTRRHSTNDSDASAIITKLRERIEELITTRKALEKEKSDLLTEVKELKAGKALAPSASALALMEHVYNRAYEIARISKEQLLKGFKA